MVADVRPWMTPGTMVMAFLLSLDPFILFASRFGQALVKTKLLLTPRHVLVFAQEEGGQDNRQSTVLFAR